MTNVEQYRPDRETCAPCMHPPTVQIKCSPTALTLQKICPPLGGHNAIGSGATPVTSSLSHIEWKTLCGEIILLNAIVSTICAFILKVL